MHWKERTSRNVGTLRHVMITYCNEVDRKIQAMRNRNLGKWSGYFTTPFSLRQEQRHATTGSQCGRREKPVAAALLRCTVGFDAASDAISPVTARPLFDDGNSNHDSIVEQSRAVSLRLSTWPDPDSRFLNSVSSQGPEITF